MKRIVRQMCGGLVVTFLIVPARAATPAPAGNPYQAVVERNVFDLKPLIPPPKVEETPQAPPAKIELQGITDGILGKRQVLLRILEAPTKPGEQPKPRSLIMDEGERRGIVTVKAINPKARTVTFDNAGKEETLVLTNSPTKLAGPMPGGAPGAIPMPVMPQPGGMAVPHAVPAPAFVAPKPAASLPSRQLRVATSGTGGEAIAGASVVGGAPALAVAPGVAQVKAPQLTPEEQTILLEVERERTKEATARGELPPLPPTELTPPGSTGMPPTPPPAAPGSN